MVKVSKVAYRVLNLCGLATFDLIVQVLLMMVMVIMMLMMVMMMLVMVMVMVMMIT